MLSPLIIRTWCHAVAVSFWLWSLLTIRPRWRVVKSDQQNTSFLGLSQATHL
jgi:hypothetical protein